MIRLASAADGHRLAEIYAPAVIGQSISFEVDAPDGAEMARRVENVCARTPWLVCERAGAVLGYAYASPYRERLAYQWSVEVSAYVAPEAHRCGVARALYTSLFAMLEVQGYRNAYAGVALPNEASVALHTAVGFTLVGVYHEVGYKLGAWHDVAWFERALAPHSVNPPPPRLLPELRDDLQLRHAMQSGLALLRIEPVRP